MFRQECVQSLAWQLILLKSSFTQDATNSRADRSAADALVREIEAAFRGSVYPGHASLTNSFMEEGLHEVQPLVGRRWRTIRYEDVVDTSEALIWLSPEAFRYYLPSYLIVSVLFGEVTPRAQRATAVMTFTLTRPADPKRRGAFDRSVRLFTPAQRVVIRRVLEFLLDSDLRLHTRQALDSYWHRI